MEGKLASCFKVKSTPQKEKSAARPAMPDEQSPDPKESFRKKLFASDVIEKPKEEVKTAEKAVERKEARQPRGTAQESVKEVRRRDRTEEDPEQARNREKARKILQNFDFSKLFNPVAPRVAKSVQVRAKQEHREIKSEFENLQQIDFKNLAEGKSDASSNKKKQKVTIQGATDIKDSRVRDTSA